MLAILAVIGVAAFASVGAFYARYTSRSDALLGLYVLFSCASQILAAKIATFDFYWFRVTAPSAVIIFAVTFLIQDVVNERFGRREAYRCVSIALLAQLGLALFIYISIALPPAPFWGDQLAWARILGGVPRITLAGWIAFAVSETMDAYVYARIRDATSGRYLWLRNAAGSVISLTVDTLIFVTIAFGFTGLPILPLMIGQFVCKYVVALLSVPFMYFNRAVLFTTFRPEAR